jgi:hypothetical protein
MSICAFIVLNIILFDELAVTFTLIRSVSASDLMWIGGMQANPWLSTRIQGARDTGSSSQ